LTGNRFLDALPSDVAEHCLARSVVRAHEPGDVIAHRGDFLADVHFPTRGAISEIEEGLDGGSTETTAIGAEGFCGIEALLDVPLCPFLRIIEVRTSAVVIPLSILLESRDRSPEFHRLAHRYAAARLHGAGISVGCNARHDVRARLARWLLRLNDRAGEDRFELTHETISRMLGVRRPTVTRVIADLSALGAVTAARNAVRIVDRSILESVCCSCYREARELYDTLYGEGTPPTSPLG
jgi:CRP-like cAMP-binding protein